MLQKIITNCQKLKIGWEKINVNIANIEETGKGNREIVSENRNSISRDILPNSHVYDWLFAWGYGVINGWKIFHYWRSTWYAQNFF